MFSFFKKKMREPEAPQHAAVTKDFVPFQQTKVEDDVASFEVPDFSEDDINFDLGLGEFMSEKNPSLLPEPKGLPVDVPPAPPVQQKQELQSQEPQTPAPQPAEATPEAQTEKMTMPVFEEPKAIPAEVKKEATVTPALSAPNWGADIPEKESPDENLPKFSISPSLSFSEMQSLSSKETQKKKTIKKTPKQIWEENKEKEKVQSSAEGLFLPKISYAKMIILSEDTSKKSGSAEAIKSDFISLSDRKDSTVEDLIKNMKAVRDSVMLADSKLFGR